MPEIKKILDEIKEDAKTWSDDLIAQLNPDLTPEQIAKAQADFGKNHTAVAIWRVEQLLHIEATARELIKKGEPHIYSNSHGYTQCFYCGHSVEDYLSQKHNKDCPWLALEQALEQAVKRE